MRRMLWMLIVGGVLTFVPASARAQVATTGYLNPYRINGYYAAPGLYGMAYGSPSFGMTRTYTSFSSPYGAGYGYGVAPYGLMPGRFGVGLWRPGFASPGYVYGASYYRTFALPASVTGVTPLTPPPVGVYAPGFGPGTYYAW